jgi:hypothetical protein
MTEFQELIKDAPKFDLMERGELVAYAYAMYAAGAKAEAENAKLMEDAADTILSLRDRAQELQAENAKLRGARDVWQENDAKLRELVRDMRTCIVHACMCEFCPLFVTEEDMGERRCIADIKARMRELGIPEEA